MRSPDRTLIGGILTVITVCFLLASLSWLQVLLVIGFSSIGWGLWSWISELEKLRRERRMQRRARLEAQPPRSRRPRVKRTGNVYQLSPRVWRAEDLRDWSGALE